MKRLLLSIFILLSMTMAGNAKEVTLEAKITGLYVDSNEQIGQTVLTITLSYVRTVVEKKLYVNVYP